MRRRDRGKAKTDCAPCEAAREALEAAVSYARQGNVRQAAKQVTSAAQNIGTAMTIKAGRITAAFTNGKR